MLLLQCDRQSWGYMLSAAGIVDPCGNLSMPAGVIIDKVYVELTLE